MNRERWLLIGAVVIFFGSGLYYYVRLGGKGLANKQRTTSVAPQPSAEPIAPQQLAQESSPAGRTVRGEIDDKTPWGRNPFLTEEEAERGSRPGTELAVKTIISGRPRSVATIDGRTVLVGEMVGEETVVEIRPDAVVLESEGRRRILRVREPSVTVEVKERRK
jgi:hypothetical protein